MLVPIVVADVMATVFIYVRLMLLPIIVADVNTTLLPLIVILADVIAMMCRCHVTIIPLPTCNALTFRLMSDTCLNIKFPRMLTNYKKHYSPKLDAMTSASSRP